MGRLRRVMPQMALAELLAEAEPDGDGYLTDAFLDLLRDQEIAFGDVPRLLVDGLPMLVSMMSCCNVEVADGATSLGAPAKVVTFHTGGWSGAEELIGILLGKPAVQMFHSAWRRGGHFTFEIPMMRLAPTPPGEDR